MEKKKKASKSSKSSKAQPSKGKNAKPQKDEKPQPQKPPKGKQYQFGGKALGAGRLVLALVHHWASAHKNATKAELLAAFPDELVGKKYGVVRDLKEAEEISKQRKRYFLAEDEIVTVGGRKYAVTNQITATIADRIIAAVGAKVKA